MAKARRKTEAGHVAEDMGKMRTAYKILVRKLASPDVTPVIKCNHQFHLVFEPQTLIVLILLHGQLSAIITHDSCGFLKERDHLGDENVDGIKVKCKVLLVLF
jgi:hypothetical protein